MRPPTPQILDFGGGFWILGILDFGDFGDLRFWILGILDFGEFGFWILGPESQIQNPKSPIQTFLAKFSGFWILDRYVAIFLCEAPTPHILDFGGDFEFWILEVGDTGFWILGILDFGILGILDFRLWGFWILAFGILGILDFWNSM